MPILVGTTIPRVDQKEFGEIAYEVMRRVFQVHAELGRCFDEKVYQRELAFRLPTAQTEAPVEVAFDGFAKTYFIDLVAGGRAIFELKAAQSLSSHHRGQLLNYLLLTDTAHGKLVNFRTERVQHEFVNSTLTHADRIAFAVEDSRWQEMPTGCLKERMLALLRDWGAGLDIALYGEVAAYFCGRAGDPYCDVEIQLAGRVLGTQQVRLAAPEAALRITALSPGDCSRFETHLRRFLAHTRLRAIQWINVTPSLVQFITIQ
jgi:GxxExxY protein